jgi:hypothetical protein
MSRGDEKLRKLERLAKQGDQEAAFAVHRERARLRLPLLPDREGDEADGYDFLYLFDNGFGAIVDDFAEHGFLQAWPVQVIYLWNGLKQEYDSKRRLQFAGRTGRNFETTSLEDPEFQSYLLHIMNKSRGDTPV